ncbi:hypothetical protein [Kiloniella sp.]|uniref:hypothetical protein n=1 Tax=Kiloniella sp. TaxID=1938587 RepID=UPI003B01F8C5
MKIVSGVSFICALALTAFAPSYAEESKKLNSNEVIQEYGKIATGIALEERCLLLSPLATREYYWQQYMLDAALNKVFSGAPVLNMVRGSALQTSRDERFKCDAESQEFIERSLQRARDLNQKLTGQVFEPNVSDQVFDQERLIIVASAAGINAVCKHLLPEYDEQLNVGLEALTKSFEEIYTDKVGTDAISKAYQETSNEPNTSCGDGTRQQALQGWQLTRLLMKQYRLAFAGE